MDTIFNDFCCRHMLYAIEQGDDSPFIYYEDTRSYIISAPNVLLKKNMVWVGYRLTCCPFCGTKLPLDLVTERSEILEKEYCITDPYDTKQKKLIPSEFKTDEWWKKRGL